VNSVSGSAFDTLDALETHLEGALKSFESNPERMRGITGWEWIIISVSNWKWNKNSSSHQATTRRRVRKKFSMNKKPRSKLRGFNFENFYIYTPRGRKFDPKG